VGEVFNEFWLSISTWVTQNDFSLNLSTELIGVFLSIPLSIFIAAWLDRSADKKRMRRSAQSVVLESVEQLKYLIEQHPDHLISRLEKGAPGVYFNKLMTETAEIAEDAVHQSIVSVRATFGDRLTPELRQALPRLVLHWKRLQKVMALEDPFFLERAAAGSDIADLTDSSLNSIQTIAGWVITRTQDVNSITTGGKKLDISHDDLDEALEKYAKILPAAIEYRLAIARRTGELDSILVDPQSERTNASSLGG